MTSIAPPRPVNRFSVLGESVLGWNRRVLYICLSAPLSSALPCPPHYKWSLIVADPNRSSKGMIHHVLMPPYYDPQVTSRAKPSSEQFYRALPLDDSSPSYYRIIALISLRRVYKINDEEGFENIIRDVDIPSPNARPGTWVRNCIWHLARTGKIEQYGEIVEHNCADDFWKEVVNNCMRWVHVVAKDDNPVYGSSEKARKVRTMEPRVIPAMMLRGDRILPVPTENAYLNRGTFWTVRDKSPKPEYRH